MQLTYNTYYDAVNCAANQVLADRALVRGKRMEQLFELLYSLDLSIPESWATRSRSLLAGRERSVDRIIQSLTLDLIEDPEHSRYFLLNTLLLLALTIKQLRDTVAF